MSERVYQFFSFAVLARPVFFCTVVYEALVLPGEIALRGIGVICRLLSALAAGCRLLLASAVGCRSLSAVGCRLLSLAAQALSLLPLCWCWLNSSELLLSFSRNELSLHFVVKELSLHLSLTALSAGTLPSLTYPVARGSRRRSMAPQPSRQNRQH